MKCLIGLLAVLACSTAINASRAQVADGLALAIEAAWQRASVAREADGQRQRASAEAQAARRWSAETPSVELGYRDDRFNRNLGSRESEVGLSWPLWMPSQRAVGIEAANAGTALADAHWRAARLRLAAEVREAYWTLALLRAEAEVTSSQRTVLERFAADVDRRVAAGDLARADALAARAEALAATGQVAEAEQRLAMARARWQQLTGIEPPLQVEAVMAVDSALRFDPDTHPEVVLAAATSEHARRRLQLAQASRRGSPEVMVGLRQEVSARGEPAQDSVQLRVRVPIGTAVTAPAQATAQAEADVAQATERQLREKLRLESELARSSFQSATAQLAAQRERAALLRERASLIEKSFNAGESALPDLLRAVSAAAQADAASARQQSAVGLAQSRLLTAFGVAP